MIRNCFPVTSIISIKRGLNQNGWGIGDDALVSHACPLKFISGMSSLFFFPLVKYQSGWGFGKAFGKGIPFLLCIMHQFLLSTRVKRILRISLYPKKEGDQYAYSEDAAIPFLPNNPMAQFQRVLSFSPTKPTFYVQERCNRVSKKGQVHHLHVIVSQPSVPLNV